MITIELFSREDCPLCHEAREVLERVQRDIPFTMKEVHVVPGTPFYEAYDAFIPVVHINGIFAFKSRVDERLLRDKLRQLTS
jgi:glutaredoxin